MNGYIELKDGNILEEGDEYSTTCGLWRTIPDFLVGDPIPISDSDTHWRRRDKTTPNNVIEKKKGWFKK